MSAAAAALFPCAAAPARCDDGSAEPPISALDRDHRSGGQPLVDGGGDNRAGNEEDCQDGGETSSGQEGVQGSHQGHSRVLRGTLCGQNGCRDLRVPAGLYLSCGQAERCLNLRLSVTAREEPSWRGDATIIRSE